MQCIGARRELPGELQITFHNNGGDDSHVPIGQYGPSGAASLVVATHMRIDLCLSEHCHPWLCRIWCFVGLRQRKWVSRDRKGRLHGYEWLQPRFIFNWVREVRQLRSAVTNIPLYV
jgi:hypothetical protein